MEIIKEVLFLCIWVSKPIQTTRLSSHVFQIIICIWCRSNSLSKRKTTRATKFFFHFCCYKQRLLFVLVASVLVTYLQNWCNRLGTAYYVHWTWPWAVMGKGGGVSRRNQINFACWCMAAICWPTCFLFARQQWWHRYSVGSLCNSLPHFLFSQITEFFFPSKIPIIDCGQWFGRFPFLTLAIASQCPCPTCEVPTIDIGIVGDGHGTGL